MEVRDICVYQHMMIQLFVFSRLLKTKYSKYSPFNFEHGEFKESSRYGGRSLKRYDNGSFRGWKFDAFGGQNWIGLWSRM